MSAGSGCRSLVVGNGGLAFRTWWIGWFNRRFSKSWSRSSNRRFTPAVMASARTAAPTPRSPRQRSILRPDIRWWWILICRNFFDRVHHQRLLDRIAQRVSDRRLLALVRGMLTAGVVMPDGTKIAVTEGTPQGGPLAPRTQKITFGSWRRGVYAPVRGTIARSVGQRDAVPDDDFVVADENFLDEKPHDALAF